jgi:hypothetical protein
MKKNKTAISDTVQSTRTSVVTKVAAPAANEPPMAYGLTPQDLIEHLPGTEFLKSESSAVKAESETPKPVKAEVTTPEQEEVVADDEVETPVAESAVAEEALADKEAEVTEETATDEETPEEETDDTTGENDDERELAGTDNVQKRIDKVIAQKKQAQEDAEKLRKEKDAEIEQLKAQLESGKGQSSSFVPSPENPLRDVFDDTALEQRLAKAREIKDWAYKNRNGATVKGPSGEDVVLSEEQVAEHYNQADAVISYHAPRRKEFIKEQRAWNAEAKGVYPKLFDPKTPEYQQALHALKKHPFLLELPNYVFVLGDLMRGQKARLDEAAAKAKPAIVKPAAVVPKAPVNLQRPVKVALAKKQSSSARTQFNAIGDQRSLESLVETLL